MNWPLSYEINPFISNASTENYNFWNEGGLNSSSDYVPAGFPAGNFCGTGQLFADEEFGDAAEVLEANKSVQDLVCNADLERSGIHTDLRVPRTESMASTDSDYVTADKYFRHRSTATENLSFLQPRCESSDGDEFEKTGKEPRRSTLTRNDFLNIIDSNNGDGVYKRTEGSSASSTFSTIRSSLGTEAAMDELDRIIHDMSSDEDGGCVVNSRTTITTKTQPVKTTIPNSKGINLPRMMDRGKSTQGAVGSSQNKSDLCSKSGVDKAVRTQIEEIKNQLQLIERETKQSKSQRLNSTFQIDAKATELLSKVMQRKTHPKSNSAGCAGEVPARIQQPCDREHDEDVDEHTAAILKRANDILSRIEQSKPKKSEATSCFKRDDDPCRTKIQFSVQEKLCGVQVLPPRSEAATSIEPCSAPQPSQLRTFSKSIQTENNSLSETSPEVSLLEQTTYPIPRNSVVPPRDIVLASRQIFFAPTEVGESACAKLQIKNYTAMTYQLYFSTLNPPFQSRYDTLNIQARRYVNLPLRFVPPSTGYFRTEMVIRADPGGVELKAFIVGEGIPKLNL